MIFSWLGSCLLLALKLRGFSLFGCVCCQCVATLREQLSELYGLEVGAIPAPTLQDYSLRLDALERSLFARQQEVRCHILLKYCLSLHI